MSSSRGKFSFKPSPLSQHTANFNKILQQLPVPKKETADIIKASLELQNNESIATLNKPSLTTTTTTDLNPINKSKDDLNPATNPKEETIKEKETEAVFVFGEKLTDRVINADIAIEKKDHTKPVNDHKQVDEEEETSSKNTTDTTEDDTNNWKSSNQIEDSIVNDESDTILKISCKLYLLEAEKQNWLERGYGILRVLKTDDESSTSNCKIMMWTDKCFRLILNTKLFEKMQIDRANMKSIRFNAFHNGTIRMFLVKTNQTDCDKLFDLLTNRLNNYKSELIDEQLSKQDDSIRTNVDNKSVIFNCDCNYYRINENDDETDLNETDSNTIEGHINLYNLIKSETLNITNTNSHELLLDLVDIKNNKVQLTTYLKLLKLKQIKQKVIDGNGSGGSGNQIKKRQRLVFELNEPSTLTATTETTTNTTTTAKKLKQKYKVFIYNKESASEFLCLFNKEPKVCPNDIDESSNGEFYDYDDEIKDDDDEDDDDVDDEDLNRKSNSTAESARLDNDSSDEENTVDSSNIKNNKKEDSNINDKFIKPQQEEESIQLQAPTSSLTVTQSLQREPPTRTESRKRRNTDDDDDDNTNDDNDTNISNNKTDSSHTMNKKKNLEINQNDN
jgi:hypothetical protein